MGLVLAPACFLYVLFLLGGVAALVASTHAPPIAAAGAA
jgi:hypothetical protein